MSIAPEDVEAAIKKHIPTFTMDYQVDPVRQQIAQSWPDAIDSTCAVDEWGFKVQYDLAKMTEDIFFSLYLFPSYKSCLGNRF